MKCQYKDHSLNVDQVCLKQQCQSYRRFLCSECFKKGLHNHIDEIYQIQELGKEIWKLIAPQIEYLNNKKINLYQILKDVRSIQATVQRITTLVNQEINLLQIDISYIQEVINKTTDEQRRNQFSNEEIEEFRAIKYLAQKRKRSRWIDKAIDVINKVKDPMVEFEKQFKEYDDKKDRQFYYRNIPNVEQGISLYQDSKYIAFGTQNQEIQIWDVEKFITNFKIKFRQTITCSQFSKDQQYLAVGCDDGQLTVFKSTEQFLQKLQVDIIPQKLTHLSWMSQEYLYVATNQRLYKFSLEKKIQVQSHDIQNIEILEYDSNRLYITFPKDNKTQLQIKNEQKKIFTQEFVDPIVQLQAYRTFVATLDKKHKLSIWYFDEKDYFLYLVKVIREPTNIINYSFIPQCEHHVIITEQLIIIKQNNSQLYRKFDHKIQGLEFQKITQQSSSKFILHKNSSLTLVSYDN